MMERRGFLSLIGGAAAVALPRAGRAQQAMPVIGFVNGQARSAFTHLLAAFHRGLNETGYVEDRSVAVEYRWAEGRIDRLPALLADLVQRRVAVIVATGGAHSAARAATTTIPIVCTMGGDAVKSGYVASINRPGGNLTGVAILSDALEEKRLELLHQLVPRTASIGVLVDPTFSAAEAQLRQVQAAARALSQQIQIVNANTEREIEAAFLTFVASKTGAIVVAANPFFNSRRDMVISLAARHAIPALYEYREAPLAGGLMSYGPSIPEAYRQVGVYAGRVLKGEKPAELPVLLPSKFEMVINLKTAKALGIAVPLTLQAQADEVIE
jgi:putative ABC transport system substrate-binding protein